MLATNFALAFHLDYHHKEGNVKDHKDNAWSRNRLPTLLMLVDLVEVD